MNFKAFQSMVSPSVEEISRQVYQQNQETIRIKKEKTAVSNFSRIFDAVFEITYEKGFQAMTMRDLSDRTSMSLGALYAYFPSKEELLRIIQNQGLSMVTSVLDHFAGRHTDPLDQLKAVIKAHIFLSESLRPWFFFMFMEARNLKPDERNAVKAMEEQTEEVLTQILERGETLGIFQPRNHSLTAGLIKAMQQDWYLKRWKYMKRDISVDEYADHVVTCVEAFCLFPAGASLSGDFSHETDR